MRGHVYIFVTSASPRKIILKIPRGNNMISLRRNGHRVSAVIVLLLHLFQKTFVVEINQMADCIVKCSK